MENLRVENMLEKTQKRITMKRNFLKLTCCFLLVSAISGIAYGINILAWHFYAPNVTSESSISSPKNGDIIYDSSNHLFKGYANGIWYTLQSLDLNFDVVEVTNTSPIAGNLRTVYFANLTDDVTLDLPSAASSAGHRISTKFVGGEGNILTIDPDGTETIDGNTTISLHTNGESVTIMSNGSNWYVLDHYIPSKWRNFTFTGDTGEWDFLNGRYRRVGQNLEVEFAFTPNTSITTGPSISWSELLADIPSAPSVEIVYANYSIGTVFMHDESASSSSDQYVGQLITNSSNFFIVNSNGTDVVDGGPSPFEWAVDDDLAIKFSIPISGW